jgi:hypothetical protein
MAGDLYLSIDFGASPSVDNGTRPYTGSNPIWNNFSLWLDGGPSQTQTRVGTPTTVKARVSNKGGQTVQNVNVDAYVMNPHVGVTTPALAIRRLSGFVASVATGSGSTSPTDPHVVTCQIQDPVQGPIPWTPTQAELTSTVNGEGHLCLIANVFADGDGGQLPDGQPFDVTRDQHQGQRNITLLPTSLLAEEQVAEFELMAAPTGEETALAIEAIDPETAIGAGERWLLRSHRDIVADREHGGLRGLAVVHDGKRFPIQFSRAELRARLYVGEIGEIGPKGPLPAFRDSLPARITLTISPEEEIGALHAFEIVQRDRKGNVLGALRMLTVITR